MHTYYVTYIYIYNILHIYIYMYIMSKKSTFATPTAISPINFLNLPWFCYWWPIWQATGSWGVILQSRFRWLGPAIGYLVYLYSNQFSALHFIVIPLFLPVKFLVISMFLFLFLYPAFLGPKITWNRQFLNRKTILHIHTYIYIYVYIYIYCRKREL